jgi:alpha-galactosidase
MDIDEFRLAQMECLAKKIAAQEKYDAVIESTTDRKEALKGADYVILMIQVGGVKAYANDVEIPRAYGLDQAVGDTLGPGGVFRGLRTIPVILDIYRDMIKLCPDALFLNYVNPMAINCMGLYRAIPDAKFIGLCHSVQGTSEDIAAYIGAPYDEVSFRCAGINHMAWFLEYTWKGQDVYPLLRERALVPEIYQKDIIKFDILKHFGYFVTESSYHMSEYVPYYRKEKRFRDDIRNMDSWLKYNEGSYLKFCKDMAEIEHILRQDMLNAETVEVTRTHEYAACIINAMQTGTPVVVNGNLENNGLITNLPQGCCVEVPCLVDRNGIQPTVIGNLPPQLAALNRTNINVQELAVLGALTGNKDAVHHAVLMDPYTSSVLNPSQIHSMVDELFEAHRHYLPQFA